jgi:short subunit dehydrogenase-like uncharacterized protein
MTDPSGDRDLDLVLLGATGFTGRLVARHLATRLEGTEVRWALAGRSRDRLEAVAGSLPGPTPALEVVDVHDLVGLVDLARRTRVLATTVGPYLQHGELVAQACARSGTHYADITGEPAFVDLLRARYGPEARRTGAKLVTCCGFDSVPHDLGVRFTVANLPDDVPVSVRGYVRGQGRISGGTAASALGIVAGSRSTAAIASPEEREPAPRRRATSLPLRLHRVPELGAWGVPLPTVDPAIVLRSARELDGYGSAFRYGHYARVSRLPVAAAGMVGLGIGPALTRFGPTRAVLGRMLPDAGDGPDEATRARSRFDVTFLGRAGDQRVATRVSGGDPGYDETARMLGEAALTLVAGEGPEVAGVLTPAVGLGLPYLDRLTAAGLRFEVLDPDHLDGADGDEDGEGDGAGG